MAGDWIKMRCDLGEHPKVWSLARLLGLSDTEVLVILYRLAGWFQAHGKHGKMRQPTGVIDLYIGQTGVAEALRNVGWLRVDDGVMTLHGFTSVSANRKGLGAKVRADVLGGAVCTACGSTGPLEIDHIVPISRGGSCERSNLQPLCGPCNAAKGRKTMDEFMAGRRA